MSANVRTIIAQVKQETQLQADIKRPYKTNQGAMMM
jgi:hypothetical protein